MTDLHGIMDDFNTDELKKRNQQMLNFFQANIDLSEDLEKKVLDKEQEVVAYFFLLVLSSMTH